MNNNNNQENKPLIKKEDFNITEQNWLMLKGIEQGKTVKDAYYAAGYEGKDDNAAYQMYWKLKKKLEMVYEADNVDSLRLKIEAKKILDMKVDERPIKPEVKLRAIETLAKLTESAKNEAKAISPFIIQKFESGSTAQIQVDKRHPTAIEPIDVVPSDVRDEEDRSLD